MSEEQVKSALTEDMAQNARSAYFHKKYPWKSSKVLEQEWLSLGNREAWTAVVTSVASDLGYEEVQVLDGPCEVAESEEADRVKRVVEVLDILKDAAIRGEISSLDGL